VTADYEQKVFFAGGKYCKFRFADKDDESVALAPGYLFASIFPPGGHTAPDVAFLFVSL
jgi:DNA gyrase inhibitor GyrI